MTYRRKFAKPLPPLGNMPTPVVAPSLLAANHGEFIAGIRTIEEAGLTWVHLDIMDGHFVPNISFGPQVVAALRPLTKLHFDVHLMLTHPDRFVAAFAQAGAERLTVHIEAEHDMGQTLAAIKAAGLKAGIAMNPDGDPRRLLPPLRSGMRMARSLRSAARPLVHQALKAAARSLPEAREAKWTRSRLASRA